jgi:hypothetical protein
MAMRKKMSPGKTIIGIAPQPALESEPELLPIARMPAAQATRVGIAPSHEPVAILRYPAAKMTCIGLAPEACSPTLAPAGVSGTLSDTLSDTPFERLPVFAMVVAGIGLLLWIAMAALIFAT